MKEYQITINEKPYTVGVVKSGQSVPKARRALRDAYPKHTAIPVRIGGRGCDVEDVEEYAEDSPKVYAELVKVGVDFTDVIAVIEVCEKVRY